MLVKSERRDDLKSFKDGPKYSKAITRRLGAIKISVVISFYGEYCNFGNVCLASLERQDFKDFEIVFIQDGPTEFDDRLKLDLFKSGLSYIYLINDCNVGALESRIRASREALGDYIAFLDHDDTYSDGFLRVMHQAAVEHGADVVECEINNVSQNGGFRFRRFDCGERRFGDEIVLQYLQGFSHNNLWNKLVLKECFDAAVLELSRDILTVNWNFFEDLLLTIAIYNNSHIYLGTCDTCYNYLQRSGSSSNPIALCKMAAAISQVAFVASYVNRKFGAVGSPRDLYLFHRRETQWALDHISCRLRLYRPRGCIEFANQVKYLIIAFMLKHRTMKVRWLAAKLASRR